jgi:hypothetical protein
VRRPPEPVDAERVGSDRAEPRRTRPSAGRTVAVVLLYAVIGLASAAAGYTLAGGRTVAGGASPTPVSSSMVTPSPATAAQDVPAATAPPAPTVPATVQPAAPAPTLAPTAPPSSVADSADPAAKPEDGAASSGQGAHLAVRPGLDARQAQIEGTISEYFEALGARDFARAQQVCCTAEWRARYPLDRWERNFDGVSDLRMVGQPRYIRTEDDIVVVDSDYTFLSGGAQRTFTLRWTFRPVGSAWQAELAEATPAE